MVKLNRLIRGALAEMRSMLIELRMGTLYNQTLEQLLLALVDSARARSQSAIKLAIPKDLPQVPEKVIMGFYRLTREAINNAMVHSGASQIDVTVSKVEGQLELRIQDDGCGFDPQLVPVGHMGIAIMRERAEEIGADYEIQSEPGQGTVVSIRWLDPTGEMEEHD
jgi:signal transduction histidine kinase